MLQLAALIIASALIFQARTHASNHDSYKHPDIMKPVNARAMEDLVEDPSFWSASAQTDLAYKLKTKDLIKRAKNIIMYLGDGMGVTTTTAARILKGQAIDNVRFGEEGQLYIDTFPHTGMSKTFCTDAQTADSACSATAYLCGIKANYGTIGVNSNVQRHDCAGQNNRYNHVSSILAWAQAAGKSTGIVTTTRITHASPAGAYAHIADRDWECDDDMSSLGSDPEKCDDIAEQLILNNPGRNVNVILGGGRKKFLPVTITDVEGAKGQRKDGKNLIDRWTASKQNGYARYVQTVEELKNVDASKTEFLLGLFSDDNLAYFGEQAKNKDPTLTDMTEKAIEILRKNPRGFFLFVEGGLIDWAHHDNKALKTMWETIEFDRAIEKGDKMTYDDDTLIVVTADHSHAFTFNGYAPRGTNITGFGGMGDDDIKFSIVNYANGPGFKPFVNNQRHNITGDNIDDINYQQVPLVPLQSETHGGEDVMIYAKGPFAHLFPGVHMQNYIPHAMAYAACVGNGMTFCKESASGWHYGVGGKGAERRRIHGLAKSPKHY